jgi:hypothetical protein
MKQIVDVHVHLAALPDGDNGCLISEKMLKGPLFRFLTWRLGLPVHEPARANEIYVQRLVGILKASRYVSQAVILAMDGVYGSDGVLDRESTEFMISNKYVLETARRFPEQLRAGVSINPQRRDALEELERCAAAGAALVKVLPNTQRFDPSEERYRIFYRAMAQRRIPLLSHVGYEFSLWGKDQSVGDPARTRLALEEGVTVIAAHGASFGLFLYEKYWDTLREFVRTYPHFYWDASALSLPNRAGMLLRLRRHPEIAERMVFGTDYPLPCFAYPALLGGRPGGYAELLTIQNPFDRHYRLLEILGLPVRPFGGLSHG